MESWKKTFKKFLQIIFFGVSFVLFLVLFFPEQCAKLKKHRERS